MRSKMFAHMPYSCVVMFLESSSVKARPVIMLVSWAAKIMKPEYWSRIVFFDKWWSRVGYGVLCWVLWAPGVGLEPARPRRATGSQGQRINPLCHPGFPVGLMLFWLVLKYLCGCGVVGFLLVLVSQALILAVCGCLLGLCGLVGRCPVVCFGCVDCYGRDSFGFVLGFSCAFEAFGGGVGGFGCERV